MIVACDGIWDVMDRERACKCLKDTLDKNSVNGCFEGNIDDCLYDLLIECMKLETTDNLSAVAVLFDEVSQRCVEFHPHQGGEAIHWYKSETEYNPCISHEGYLLTWIQILYPNQYWVMRF